MSLIEIKGLYKIFGAYPKQVLEKVRRGMSKGQLLEQTDHTLGLEDINLSIEEGEIFVIMGLSGSGKSTLIRHFNRLIEPTAGEILIQGTNICDLSPKSMNEFRKKHLAMVFQRFALLPHKTILDNVGYGLHIQKLPKKAVQAKAQKWVDTVGLSGYESHYPSQLSGGQQQRVGLARALCTDAPILLMDEAFSALDPLIRSDMQSQLIALQQQLQKTIIFITHDLDEALRLGDKIAILKDGQLVQQGRPIDILQKPANQYVADFVNDVNKAKAMQVRHFMQPLLQVQAANDMDESLWVDQNANLESVMPKLLGQKQDLWVLDEKQQICGKLSSKDVAKVYALHSQ